MIPNKIDETINLLSEWVKNYPEVTLRPMISDCFEDMKNKDEMKKLKKE